MSEILEKRTSPDYWICPCCGRENGTGAFCPGCGFDNSTNYTAYPTLVELPKQINGTKRTVADLDTEVQQLSAEVQRLRAEIQSLKTTQSAQESLIRSLKVAQSAQESLIRSLKTAQPAQVRPSQGLMGNVGRRRYGSNVPSLDNVTAKNKITEVYFLDTLKKAPKNAADLSEAKDRSVLCWAEGTVQYIAGNGGVAGGSSCKNLFAYYTNVTAIHFNGNFDTSRVTGMSYMFCGCSNLKLLNLSGWDTSHVINMSKMFSGCSALKSLNLSGWNTSRVEKMIDMFYGCSALTNFNPAWLDTSNADTTFMYLGTKWGSILDF